MKRWVALVLALGIAGAGLAYLRDRHPRRRLALIYGDSLTFESQWAIRQTREPGWRVKPIAVGSAAACDMLANLPSQLPLHPAVVAVETTGSTLTSCMHGIQPGTSAYYAKYEADLRALFARAHAAGARSLFIEPPPMDSPTWTAEIARITSIVRALPDVTVTTAPRDAVTDHGRFVRTLPCLHDEPGCKGGRVQIRSWSLEDPGVHFCPVAFRTAPPYGCPVYSGGELRFGRAEAVAVTR